MSPQLVQPDAQQTVPPTMSVVQGLQAPPIAILYHDGCTDGLVAAWAALKAFPGSQLKPVRYNQPPPEGLDGHRVFIVDFCYPRATILEMLGRVHSLVILDHHKSAQADLDGLHHKKLDVVFDMKRSGAGITWDTLLPDERPWFVATVEDYDLWRFKDPTTKALIEYIRSWPPTVQSIDRLPPDEPGYSAIGQGQAILRFKQEQVAQSVKLAQEILLVVPEGPWMGEYETLAVNVPFFLSSEVGNALAKLNEEAGRTPLGITFYQRADGMFSLSLRSLGEVDVSTLARSLDPEGGGHRNAAGASVKELPWDTYEEGETMDIQTVSPEGDRLAHKAEQAWRLLDTGNAYGSDATTAMTMLQEAVDSYSPKSKMNCPQCKYQSGHAPFCLGRPLTT